MWITREENGLLRLYTKKPYRYIGGIWRIPNDGDCVNISDEEYPQCKSITWEDDPIWVDLVLSKPFNFKLSEEIKEKLEKDFGDSIENIKKTPIESI